MKNKFFILIILISALSFSLKVKADTPSVLAEQAKTAFQAGDYQKAAQLWEDLYQLGFDNLNLHYNRAQAYWHLGEKGKSLAALYKARSFDKGDPHLKPGIEILEQSLGLPQNDFLKSLDFFPWWRLYLSRDQALWFFALSSLAFFAYLFLKLFKKEISHWISLSLTFIFLLSSFQLFSYVSFTHQALVVVKKAGLKKDPIGDAEILASVHEGQRLKVLKQDAYYALVETSEGERGYLAKENLGEF
ncbi:MAG: hypothetical protein KDK66_07380 [Deltaproteobacteria bacterium]|nr:hypothetical protein [Deltaproteobacteria bacterium]